MNTDFIKGVVVPILTPIDENEKIDEARLRDQVDYVIEGGVLESTAFSSNGRILWSRGRDGRSLKIMLDKQQRTGSSFISESVPSAQRNAAGWRRWPWAQEQQESPFFSPCF